MNMTKSVFVFFVSVLLTGCINQSTTRYFYVPSARVYIITQDTDGQHDVYISDHLIPQKNINTFSTRLTVSNSSAQMLFFPKKRDNSTPFYFFVDNSDCMSLDARFSYVIFPLSCDSLWNNCNYVPIQVPITNNPKNGHEPEADVIEIMEEEYNLLLNEQGERLEKEYYTRPVLARPFAGGEIPNKSDAIQIQLLDNGFTYGSNTIECTYVNSVYTPVSFWICSRFPNVLFVDASRNIELHSRWDEYVINGPPLTIVRTNLVNHVVNCSEEHGMWRNVRVYYTGKKWWSELN